MANNVTLVELGGSPKVVNSTNTVSELASQNGIGSGLAVTINGKSADYDTTLNDYDFVSFGAKVKGGNK